MRDVFGTYHPIINFIYFGAVIIFGMFFLHPVLLGISVTAAFIYSILLNGRAAIKFNLAFVLPMLAVLAVMNPLFNHRGMTIIFYLGNNPITMESVVYGVVTGFMFAGVILWFSCYNAVMTSDKFVYLFGRMIPAMSLIFSMVLRFVPKFKTKAKEISGAQKCVGRDVSNGNIREKARHGMKIMSVMITWALENAVDTADSMRARGYGLPGRSAFSVFRFDGRDRGMLALIILLSALIGAGVALGLCSAEFFPRILLTELRASSLALYFVYFLLCFLPIILDVKEEFKWRHLRSRI